jgi:hypothetical protein
MSIPIRNADQSQVIASERTFFVTSSTWAKRGLLQSTRAAGLFIDVLYHYRSQRKYLLHEFVIMPDQLNRLFHGHPGAYCDQGVEMSSTHRRCA